MLNLEKLIEPLLPGLIEFRHDIHAHPETAFEEHRTAGRILEHLEKLPGLEIRAGVAKTGIVATLGAEKTGPCLALRADMDALPMSEDSDKPYASRHPGVAHACGHDGHVTCLLGAAQVLSKVADRLVGPVKFVFQPAEEGGGGGAIMCEEGALENPRVDASLALHGHPYLPVGEIAVRSGVAMASTDAVNIKVIGRGTHAASAHRGADPIVAAAHIVTALQTIVSRRVAPEEAAVVTIGAIAGGTARNIIPEKVELMGTIRALSEDTRQVAQKSLRQIVEQTAAALGVRAEVEIKTGYPVLSNDERLARFVREVATEALGEGAVSEPPVSLGGEDFSFYAEHAPIAMWRLGVNSPGDEVIPLHNPRYDFGDAAIAVGVRLHVAAALKFNESNPLGPR